MKTTEQLLSDLEQVFPPDEVKFGELTLRQGDEIDSSYACTPDFASEKSDWRRVDDHYLNTHHYGLRFLDDESWIFYIPAFIRHSLLYKDDANIFMEIFSNLRPGEEHSAAHKLSREQIAIISDALEYIVLTPRSRNDTYASQLIDEGWAEHLTQNKSGERTA